MRLVMLFLLGLFLLPPVSNVRGDEPFSVVAARTDVTDLSRLSDLDVYKYEVTVRKGQKLAVVLEYQEFATDKGNQPIRREVTARADGKATLLVGFLREDRKLASFLLSDEKRADFKFVWEGAISDGLNGLVSNPLADTPLGSKALTIHPKPEVLPDGRYELLLLYRARYIEKQGLEQLYPRAALVIEILK